MSQFSDVFNRTGHKALIAYLTVGYPSLNATLETAVALAEWGCDILELGIPFSDPLADGATIQEASFQALKQGVTPTICLEVAAKLRQRIDVPLVFMTYYNPVFSFGLEKFCQSSVAAGINGLIVPDLPPEEGADLERAAWQEGLDIIYLLTPTSGEERIHLVAERSRGFIYLVSLTGVTGVRETLPFELENFVSLVRRETALPLCVGFGISTPEQAQRVAHIADGVIVGSRILQLMKEHPTPELKALVTGLRDALDSC